MVPRSPLLCQKYLLLVTYYFADVRSGDSGNYTCQKRDKANDEVIEESDPLTLEVMYAPSIGNQKIMITDIIYINTLITCKLVFRHVLFHEKLIFWC